ncbi:MAG TPA: hypothetical protein VFX98_05930 [Longimicrobiaceae bacterium]|nr:hypothetical protein [Longimicrobiaceae bacterium]
MLLVPFSLAGLLLAAALLPAASYPRATLAGRDTVPSVCRLTLPLPSQFEFRKSEYEAILGRFLQAECYVHQGWARDRQLRITGPTSASIGGKDPHAAWTTATWGMHNTVLIYYSPDVIRWLCERDAATGGRYAQQCREQCPTCDRSIRDTARIRPIADGSMILKEMYGNTTERFLQNRSPVGVPRPGMALMVKDRQGSRDGWWWGAWVPAPSLSDSAQLDWPPPVNFPYPWMGFGYYCVNCHSSANNGEFTFSDLQHVYGDPNDFDTYYFQDQPPLLPSTGRATAVLRAVEDPLPGGSHEEKLPVPPDSTGRFRAAPRAVAMPGPNPAVNRVSEPLSNYSIEFLYIYEAPSMDAPNWSTIGPLMMPPEPYDHLGSGPDGPPLFLTSDQCVSCHAAGATGMHFDMTLQPMDTVAFTGMINLAPYGEWRGSPMGLAGRDPIFFSQLETEEKLHDGLGKTVPDLCLHCHGVMGQRQSCLDQFPDPAEGNRVCNNTNLMGLNLNGPPNPPRRLYDRQVLNVIPYGAVTPREQLDSRYAGLSRDGVSCAVCHHIKIEDEPIGLTFTGDFRVGPPDTIFGPFGGPKQVPMEHSLGITPDSTDQIRNSKLCGSCHSVVLPVFEGNRRITLPGDTTTKFIIEQATFPEWVFSDFRDDGPTPQSCQDCHMRTTYPGLVNTDTVNGRPRTWPDTLSFKIAAIQEASNMPQVQNRRPLDEIDLEPRSPFARHTLVGLNVFFNKFAQQFPDVLGIRIFDPMLVGHGVAPLATTFNSMVQQADSLTATLALADVGVRRDSLVATVQLRSLVGHKFPSGVGFRRAFLEFLVLDVAGRVLWGSGRTTAMGVIVNGTGTAVKGEFFWGRQCQPMPTAQQQSGFQPHYTRITRQDQAQIYQELTFDPGGRFTTSFLALDTALKDNRLLPRGWTPSVALAERTGLGSPKLPAEALVEHVLPTLPAPGGGTVDDPWYRPGRGGGDDVEYAVALKDLPQGPQVGAVQATLFYQAIPPFYLQDRFCNTPQGPDTRRLFFLAGHTDLSGTRAADWKLRVVSTGPVPVPR